MPEEIVIDTGPLSVFAEAGWLGMLRAVADDRAVVITDVVQAELREGTPAHQHLHTVLDAGWITCRPLTSAAEIGAYQHFAGFLVSGNHNQGEASVLAYAQVHGALAIVDDGAARKHAKNSQLNFQGTLALLCEAVRRGTASIEMISTIADHMLETEYRLPFGPGEFADWAKTHDLV
ncbi:hypothetical protein [Myceligenerans crystallogenes]|uniref:Nucleic acid-binding protein n=1 Tax=Myceligenerans crystallogenes TaxID=316335 RepID=A0ABN2NIQ6_9MICO